MTTTTAVPPEVAAYLAAVRDALSDLPAAERDDMLADVEASVIEAAVESDAPIAARLGRPEEFASELRVAAGLQPPAEGRARTPRLFELASRALASPSVVAVRALGRELAPIWWVARAYLALASVALLLDEDWSARFPGVPRFGGVWSTIALFAMAAVISVAAGLWGRRRPRLRLVFTGVNALLALAIVPVLAHVADWRTVPPVIHTVSAPPPSGLVYEGARLTNLYPYSRDGRLLHDVLLYTEFGRPLNLAGAPDPNRRVLRTRDGEPLYNSFPIRYYEPGTRRVARPNAGPRIRTPDVRTPPLVDERRRRK